MASDEAVVLASCIQAVSNYSSLGGAASMALGLYSSVSRETKLGPLNKIGEAKSDADFRNIAIAIGYHFWHVDNDEKAYQCGKDAARDVMLRLENR